MPITKTSDTTSFDIEAIRGELLVTWTKTITHYPTQTYEGHGFHVMNEDEIEIEIDSAEVVICGVGIVITHLLNKNQIEYLKSEVETIYA